MTPTDARPTRDPHVQQKRTNKEIKRRSAVVGMPARGDGRDEAAGDQAELTPALLRES